MLGPAGSVHLHSSSVVHGLLLLLHYLSNAHANFLAEQYEAVVVIAALRVVAQQCPYALADLAASCDLELALGCVLEEASSWRSAWRDSFASCTWPLGPEV